MNRFKTITSAVLISGVFLIPQAHAGSLTSGDYKQIRLTANSICTAVGDIFYKRTRLSVEAAIQARTNLLIAKVSGGAKIKYKKDNSSGILAKDVAGAIKYGVIQGDKCKLEVFKALI